jgi:fatty-acyl-CoA synthase
MTEAEYLADLAQRQAEVWPEGVLREVQYPLGEIPLSAHVTHWANVKPDRPAIHFYGRDITWAELDAQSDRVGALLLDLGVGPGDRVAVFMPNCPQFHYVFYGLLKIGAVHVPISPLSTGDELGYVLDDTGARVIFCLDQLGDMAVKQARARGIEQVFATSIREMLPDDPVLPVPASIAGETKQVVGAQALLPVLGEITRRPLSGADLDSPAALNYTGGTTGQPKGCVHTQRDMVLTGASNWSLTAVRDEIVSLNFFPEFWIAGENAALIFPLMTGSPLVLMTRWDPLGVLQAIETYGVQTFPMVVDGALELMDHPRFDDFDLSTLTRVRVVSFVKKLDRDIRAKWFACTGTILSEGAYGMTETHTSNSFTMGMQEDDFDLQQRPVFVGLPVPGNEFVIRDFDNGEILPLGEEGEITLRSPVLLKSYWGKAEATAEALRDGFLYTGDIGMIDERGYLYYLGRRKEMLKVRGMSVFPAEIEAVLGKHPDVAICGVVGRADAHAGQIPVAFIQTHEGAEPEAFRAWLAERISKYKVPEIRLVPGLPMTATGKVRKAELAQWVED